MTVSRKEFRTTLKRMRVTNDDRTTRNEQIAQRLLQNSTAIQVPNFTAIAEADIRSLFDCYDDLYFDGLLRRTLGDIPLGFRMSSRMTRAGGKTSAWRKNKGAPIERLEISISSTLLYQTFNEEQAERTIRVTGLECHHRLHALMRVMEHELVHLSELLGWDASSCRQDRFQTLAWQTFGHTDHRHALITPREHAASLGVHAGAQVRFDFDGQSLYGIVNRITRRATVLVLDDDGERFSDGHTYRKYYVPLQSLEPISGKG